MIRTLLPTMVGQIATAIAIVTVSITASGCAIPTRPGSPEALQQVFIDPKATDDQLRAAFAELRKEPSTEEGERWVAIYRDNSRSDTCRRLAFLTFADRYFRPGVNLDELVARFKIGDWFTRETFGDWTFSSSTPLDRAFRLGRSDFGIYVLATPQNLRARRDIGYVCFAIPSRVPEEDLIERIRKGPPPDRLSRPGDGEDDLILAGVHVNYPEEDLPAGWNRDDDRGYGWERR